MRNVSNFTSKNVTLNIENLQAVQPVAHALSTQLRLQILLLLDHHGMSVNEIARALDVPVSTAALNVQVLEKAGLITCDTQPGVRGTVKICDRRIDSLVIHLTAGAQSQNRIHRYEMPVGGYSLAGDIRPTCGLAGRNGPFNMDDSPAAFYHPARFSADLLWAREGYVEYLFPAVNHALDEIEYLEFSFEACSEAPCYRNDWPSQIYVCVNGQEIGIWNCPGDFGGRRGLLNPDWWVDANTQYGQLKTWRINHRGSFLENQSVSGICLRDLALDKADHITLRIGTKKEKGVAGGFNLFGKGFGDYPQGIVMRYMCKS